jgi:hypothetical protein
MLKLAKYIFQKRKKNKKILKENKESDGIGHLSKWNPQI